MQSASATMRRIAISTASGSFRWPRAVPPASAAGTD